MYTNNKGNVSYKAYEHKNVHNLTS